MSGEPTGVSPRRGREATSVLRRRTPPDARPRRLRLAIAYMDFVAIVWVVFYLAVCVA